MICWHLKKMLTSHQRENIIAGLMGQLRAYSGYIHFVAKASISCCESFYAVRTIPLLFVKSNYLLTLYYFQQPIIMFFGTTNLLHFLSLASQVHFFFCFVAFSLLIFRSFVRSLRRLQFSFALTGMKYSVK
jgi:hypothetical protein